MSAYQAISDYMTMKYRVIDLLRDYSPNEIGRLIGWSDDDALRLVHDIYINVWKLTGWRPEQISTHPVGYALYCDQGAEYIDNTGNYLWFDTEAEANQYVRENIDE